MNLSNDTFNATDPNVQNVGNNVYAVWTEASHGIWFRVSVDGGQAWSSEIRLSPTGEGTPGFPLMTAVGTDVYVSLVSKRKHLLRGQHQQWHLISECYRCKRYHSIESNTCSCGVRQRRLCGIRWRRSLVCYCELQQWSHLDGTI